MLQEMKELNDLFPFLPDNIETCKSADMFKKTEDGRKFQEIHFRSTICTFQMEKVNGWNCAWCIQRPDDEAEAMKCKVFIPPPRTVARNNEHYFEWNYVLVTDADLQDLCCPFKFKKLGSNPNSSSIKMKNLVRSKTWHSTCFKHRPIYAFSVLDKNQKEILLEYIKVYPHQSGLPLFPNNNIEHAHVYFGSNILETNHSLAWEDKAEIRMDNVFPSWKCCRKEYIILDSPKVNLPIHNHCLG